MSDSTEQKVDEPTATTESMTDSLADAMHDSWPLFRAHHPSGAYLPVGRLDGDCSYKTCGGSWPCAEVIDFFAGTLDKFAEDRNLADDPGGHLAEQARRRAEENAHRIALIRDRAKNQKMVQWERCTDGPGYQLSDPSLMAERFVTALADINELLALIPATQPANTEPSTTEPVSDGMQEAADAIQRDSDNRELAERFASQTSTKAGAEEEINDCLDPERRPDHQATGEPSIHGEYDKCDVCGSANKNHGAGLSRSDHKFAPKSPDVQRAPKPEDWTPDRYYREEQDRAEARDLMRAIEFRP